MTDARWDDDDRRKIRSSLLHKKHLPSHHLHLALPSVLETLVSQTQAVLDLLAQNCLLGCHSRVAQLQLQPLLLRGPILLHWEGKHKFSANELISTKSTKSDGGHSHFSCDQQLLQP
jgi:hypothetical protein